jgi:hypothetical protein
VNVISRRLAIGIKLTVLVLASIALQQKLLAASDAAGLLLESLEASKPDWLRDLAKCPFDVMPARETKPDYSSDRYATDLERCIDNCRAGDASDCYASALVLQRVRNNPISEALFLKACSLGIAQIGPLAGRIRAAATALSNLSKGLRLQ